MLDRELQEFILEGSYSKQRPAGMENGLCSVCKFKL